MNQPAQLYLLIGDQYYHVERLLIDSQVRAKGWKLTHFDDKQGHGPYCVIRQPSGRITCECADASFVKSKTGGDCKHAKSLIEIGLL